MMEGQIKKKCSKKNIAEIIVVLILIVVVGYFVFYRPLLKYINTHTWATIQVYGTVSAETFDTFEDCREFLQGDIYQLHSTTVTIGDITHNGEVTIKFEPVVKNSDTDELIETVVIGREDVLDIKEICNDGDTATWQFRVISNRYQ